MKLKQWVVVACGIVLAVLLASLFATRMSDRHYSTHKSISRASGVIGACLDYRRHPKSGGRYPVSLDELEHPPFPSDPLPAFSTERELRDGWGKRLRYALVINEKGEAEPHAWAERVVNGKTHLCGAKATATGEVVMFGLPE